MANKARWKKNKTDAAAAAAAATAASTTTLTKEVESLTHILVK